MIYPGLVSVTFRQLAPRDIVGLVSRAGVAGIEWGGDVHVPHGDRARAEEVARMTRDAGLKVSAYGSYYRAGTSEEKGLPFEKVLASAVTLGAPTVRVWAGASGSGQASVEERSRVVRDSRRIADLAATAQVTVSFEFHGGTLNDTPDAAIRFLDELAHPNLRTFWQPPVGASASDCQDGLTRLLPRVSNLHVFQWDAVAKQRFPLAQGWECWPPYLALVRASGRDHFASIEFVRDDSADAFLEDAQALRSWLSAP